MGRERWVRIKWNGTTLRTHGRMHSQSMITVHFMYLGAAAQQGQGQSIMTATPRLWSKTLLNSTRVTAVRAPVVAVTWQKHVNKSPAQPNSKGRGLETLLWRDYFLAIRNPIELYKFLNKIFM
jgi:hypothetical protein